MAKILFIEDNDQLIKLYQGALEDAGYEVVLAKTGKEGLNFAKAEKPDAIILDIMLPGDMNGFDVLERLKSSPELNKSPVLVLTNLDGEEKVAKDIGAVEYMVKAHVNPKDVVEKIKKILH